MTRTYGERHWGFTPAPRPPRDLEQEMFEAGRDGDHVRLGVAQQRYEAWAAEHGYTTGVRGTRTPDGAIR